MLITAGVLGGCADNNKTNEDTTVSESLITETVMTDTDSSSNKKTFLNETKEDRIITSVTADSMTGLLISTDSSFTITSSQDIPAESLKSLLSLSSGSDFSLEKAESCVYKLKAADSFPENSMAVLTLNNSEGQAEYKWAFQT